jgi:DNA-binding response OmpR family regulator
LQIGTETLPLPARVLLLEDEPLIAMEEESVLQALGIDVVCVRTANEGLDVLGSGRFDAALLDWKLGAGSSVGVAHRLSEMGVPFIFLTGYQEDAIPDEFRGRPIVHKPFTADQLRNAVTALVRTPSRRNGTTPIAP